MPQQESELVDLTGGTPERRQVDETGEEVPATGAGDFDDDRDVFDQNSLTEYFEHEYTGTGEFTPIAWLVSSHYEKLNKLKRKKKIKNEKEKIHYCRLRKPKSNLHITLHKV